MPPAPAASSGGRRRAALLTALSSYVSAAFGVLTNLILVPVYLHYFSLETYGAWLASGGVVFMLSILDGGLSTIVLQRLSASAGANDAAALARVAGSGWLLNACICALMMLAGLLLAPHVPGWINAAPADAAALQRGFVYAACGTALSLAQANLLYFAQARLRTGFIVFTTSCALVGGLLGTLGALWQGLGVTALGVAILARGSTGFALALGYTSLMWRRAGLPVPTPQWEETQMQLRLMVPAFLGRTGVALLYYGEPSIVSAYLGPSAAAVLSLTNKAFGVCLMLLNPLAGGAMAGIAHLAKSEGKARTTAVVRELCTLSGTGSALLLGMALALNQPFLQAWVGGVSYGGLGLSAMLCVTAALVHRLNLLGAVVPALGIIGPSSLGTGVQGVLQVGLLALLLPRLGLVGMPLSTFCAGLLTNAWWFPWLLSRYFEIPWRQGARLAAAGGITLAVGLSAGLLLALGLAGILPAVGSWGAFVGLGVAGAGVVLGCVWLQSLEARQWVVWGWRKLLR